MGHLFYFQVFSQDIKGNDSIRLKCMIQMNDYQGFGAYIIISLINPEGNYEETLFVQGKDKEWYSELSYWWRFYRKTRNNIEAKTDLATSLINFGLSPEFVAEQMLSMETPKYARLDMDLDQAIMLIKSWI